MGSNWITANWIELLQSFGIMGGFFLTGYVAWKDEHARRIGNSIAITEQYRQIWKELYRHPELDRVLAKDVDFVTGRLKTSHLRALQNRPHQGA